MPFAPGVSGNPEGRRSGLTAKLREMLDPDLPELVQKVITQARGGCLQSQRLLLERVWPALKAEAAPVQLPEFRPDGPFVAQGCVIMKAVAAGELAPDVGAQLMAAVASHASIKTVTELEDLVRQLKGEHEHGDIA